MSGGGGVVLVLGGARSGKSRHAQTIAEAALPRPGGRLVFVATAEAFDDEMAERIDRHRADRGAEWLTREAPVDLAAAISAEDRPGTVILVDCLTLWTSNLLLLDRDLDAAAADLAAVLAEASATVVLVANEVGFGIVPDNPLARRFRDAAGWLNQRIAAMATRVELVVAGLPLRLK